MEQQKIRLMCKLYGIQMMLRTIDNSCRSIRNRKIRNLGKIIKLNYNDNN